MVRKWPVASSNTAHCKSEVQEYTEMKVAVRVTKL